MWPLLMQWCGIIFSSVSYTVKMEPYHSNHCLLFFLLVLLGFSSWMSATTSFNRTFHWNYSADRSYSPIFQYWCYWDTMFVLIICYKYLMLYTTCHNLTQLFVWFFTLLHETLQTFSKWYIQNWINNLKAWCD